MPSGDRKLNFLYLCADRGISLSGTKGASAHIREFASALLRGGHRVTAAVRETKGESPGALPFRVVTLPRGSSGKSLESVAGPGNKHAALELEEYNLNRAIEKALTDLIALEKFDVVYERYSLFSEAGIACAGAAGLPFILEVNSPLVLEASRYRGLALAGVAEKIESRLFSSADHVIAVSNQLKKYILSVSPDARVTVVPNGVDPSRFGPGDGAPKAAPPGKFTVGFVGNIRPWHGIGNLIEAFAKFVSRGEDGRLLIVGDAGKMRTELEDQCRARGLDGRVTFTGAVAPERIPQIMREIDVAVAPYPALPDFYFSALKIFEYMAAGKAIVASRIGQIGEVLEDGKTALLVPPGDCEALADALVSLSSDRALAGELGRNARAEAECSHAWEKRLSIIAEIACSLRPAPKS